MKTKISNPIDILTLARHLEDKLAQAEEAGQLVEALVIENCLEHFTDAGLFFCSCCNRLSDEMALDDEQICSECFSDRRLKASDDLQYRTRSI